MEMPQNDVLNILLTLNRYYREAMSEAGLTEDQMVAVMTGVMKRQLDDISRIMLNS